VATVFQCERCYALDKFNINDWKTLSLHADYAIVTPVPDTYDIPV